MNVFGETADTFLNTLVSTLDENSILIRNNDQKISSITKHLYETQDLATNNLSKIKSIETNIETLNDNYESFKYTNNKTIVGIIETLDNLRNNQRMISQILNRLNSLEVFLADSTEFRKPTD